jgi:hypothetical protein
MFRNLYLRFMLFANDVKDVKIQMDVKLLTIKISLLTFTNKRLVNDSKISRKCQIYQN